MAAGARTSISLRKNDNVAGIDDWINRRQLDSSSPAFRPFSIPVRGAWIGEIGDYREMIAEAATVDAGGVSSAAIHQSIRETPTDKYMVDLRRRSRLAWTAKGRGQPAATSKSVTHTSGFCGSFTELTSNQVFESMAAYMEWQFNITGQGTPEHVDGAKVSADFFKVLGVTPEIGRAFDPGEDRIGANHEVIISHEFWATKFGSDRGALGRTLNVDGQTGNGDRRRARYDQVP